MKVTCLDCGTYRKVACPVCLKDNIVMYTGVSECTATEMQKKLCLEGLGCFCEAMPENTPPKSRLLAPSARTSDGGSSTYYDLPSNCDTVQDLIEAYDMRAGRANMLKAVIRWEVKGVSSDPLENMIYNLEKIKWFANDKLKRLEEERVRNATKSRS